MGEIYFCEFVHYEHNPRGQYSIKLARAVLPSYEIRSQLAQNNAQDGGPITGNIRILMKISPRREFFDEGGAVAIFYDSYK